MSNRNVAELHSGAGEISEFCVFGRETHLLETVNRKRKLLRDARWFQQRKFSVNGEKCFVRFVVLFSF